VLLRQLNQNDFGPIFKLWFSEIYRGAVRKLYRRDQFFLKTFNDLSQVFSTEHRCFVGAEENGKIVAAALGVGSPLDARLFQGVFLWVDSSRRNQGHGEALANVLYCWAKEHGYSRFAVEAPSKNIPLKRILQKIGLHSTRTIWVKVESD
jgi:GNAT superfamily N-acetyltransferase